MNPPPTTPNEAVRHDPGSMDRCKMCGMTHAEHDTYRSPEAPTPRVPCSLLVQNFVPIEVEKHQCVNHCDGETHYLRHDEIDQKKSPCIPTATTAESLREEWDFEANFWDEFVHQLADTELVPPAVMNHLYSYSRKSIEAKLSLSRAEEYAVLRGKVEAMKPILWNDDPNRHLENVARYNTLDEVLTLLDAHYKEL